MSAPKNPVQNANTDDAVAPVLSDAQVASTAITTVATSLSTLNINAAEWIPRLRSAVPTLAVPPENLASSVTTGQNTLPMKEKVSNATQFIKAERTENISHGSIAAIGGGALANDESYSLIPPDGVFKINWTNSKTVEAAHELILYNLLIAKTEDQLIQIFIDANLDAAEGMNIYQTVNLLRHVLQDKMGERFHSLSILGTPSGAKLVAGVWESIVQDYLKSSGVSFQTEEVLLREWKEKKQQQLLHPILIDKKEGATIFACVRQFFPLGDKDYKGRTLFTGPCFKCAKACKVPFKPIYNQHTPVPPPICPTCQKESHSTLLTPDFLFPSSVTINGTKVAWLDCKCFYGNASCSTSNASIISQSAKYVGRWGPGAIAFAFGFCSSLHIEGVLLLDASTLDLSRLRDAIIRDANTKQIEVWYDKNII